MTVVDCSFIQCSRPAAPGSGNAPATLGDAARRPRADRAGQGLGGVRLRQAFVSAAAAVASWAS